MKTSILLTLIFFAASCSSSRQVTKEDILAKHLDGKELELDADRTPASNARPKSHHFKTALDQMDRMHYMYY